MTELDPSLLTDEESAIVARYEPEPNLYHHQEYLAARHNVNLLARALIAARAENKRLLDNGRDLHDRLVKLVEKSNRMRDALHSIFMSPSEYDGWKQPDLVNALEAAQTLAMVALGYGEEAIRVLQSEKEGE